jgi:hypothetical protein
LIAILKLKVRSIISKRKGAIVNGQFRDTDNTWSSRKKKKKTQKNTTQHTKLNDEQLNPHNNN